MPKPLSPTKELAIWFVENILEEHFDWRVDGYHLKKAKEWVNPDPDPDTGEIPVVYTVDEIKGYILALRDGTTAVTDYLPFSEWAGGNIRSLGILASPVRGVGKSFISLLSETPAPPPVYQGQEFAEWVREYGQRAYQRGKWDGIFRWFPGETPGVCPRMSVDEFESIMGSELALRSIEEWERVRKRKPPEGV